MSTEAPEILLSHYLKTLKLPTFQREYQKLARQCAAEDVDHVGYLTRLAEREMIERDRRKVDAREVAERAEALKAAGCESVCVFFINGYANNDNEAVAVEAVRSVWPNAYVTAATEIVPEIREFERLSTATLNAYLQPVVSSYLDRLEKPWKREAPAATC